MTQSPCKRDTKSKSHPSSRLAPVQVFSCKLPLGKIAGLFMSCMVVCPHVRESNSVGDVGFHPDSRYWIPVFVSRTWILDSNR